jgi:hypothetical protein
MVLGVGAMLRRGVSMDVSAHYFDGCPSWRTARDRLGVVLEELDLGHASVALERVPTQEDTERLRFVGSPTILVDGRDAFPSSVEECGLNCRLYETPDGLAGAPTTEQLRGILSGPV